MSVAVRTPFSIWLKKSGWTLKDVANELGVTFVTAYRWSNGERFPGPNHIAALIKLSKGELSFDDLRNRSGVR